MTTNHPRTGQRLVNEPDQAPRSTLPLASRTTAGGTGDRTAESLQKHWDYLHGIIDTTPECIKLVAPDGRLLDMNPAGLAMVEAESADEVIGQLVYGLIAPEDRDAFQAFNERICHGEQGVLEFGIVGLRGTHRRMETHAAPIPGPYGERFVQLAISRDVTDRRRADERLRASEERYRLAMRATNDVIWDWNLATDQVVWSEALLPVFGYRPEEAGSESDTAMKWWTGRIHPEDRAGICARLHWALHSGEEVFVSEYRFQRADGAYASVLDRGYISRDGQGQPVRMVGAMADISERRRAEQALQALSRRLWEVQEEERRHLARELHDEIGQILTSIHLGLHAVRAESGAQAQPRLDECLKTLAEAIERVRGLSLDLRPTVLDVLGLEAALRWYVERLAQRAGFRGEVLGHLETARLPENLQIACFRVAQEALTNVARHARARHVWVELRHEETEIRLSVRDDGVGFDVAAARGRASNGRSLGVLGMQERVELAGGRLAIVSAPARGTTVVARFPWPAPSQGGEGGS